MSAIPQKFGRYEILREVGHGAMGVVYEALDPTIGRKIALKAIRFDGIGTTADEAARRFKNEARAAGGLNHPNIVTVYDAEIGRASCRERGRSWGGGRHFQKKMIGM